MKGIGRNIIYNVLYNLLIMFVPLITSPYLSRTLGATQIGVYSYTYSIVFYFMIFAVLGINNYGNRSIARVRDDEARTNQVFCSIYTIQLILSIVVIAAYALYCYFIVSENIVMTWIQGLYIVSNLLDITWYFYGKENFKLTVMRNTVVKLSALALILCFVKNPADLWKYTLIMAGSTVIGQAAMWPSLLKEVDLVQPKYSEIVEHIKPICILFIPVLSISIFSYMDKIMLGRMSSMTETGYYENSEKIISIPKSIITAIGTVMLPHTANMLAKGENEKIKKSIRLTMIFVQAIAFACAFGLAGVADTFAPVFWGKSFMPCGSIIMWMTPALVFSVFGNVIRTQYLIPNEMDIEYTISLALGAITNFIVNYLLIDNYGALGATVGTVAAEVVLCLYQVWSVRKKLEIRRYLQCGIPFCIFGFIMFAIVKFVEKNVPTSVTGLILEIILGAIVYILLCFVYLKNTKDNDKQEIYAFLKLKFNKIVTK